MTDHNQLVSTLNELIETSKDGELGFRKAAKLAKSPELKGVFEEFAGHCANAANDLQLCVRTVGGVPDESGSPSGAAHRGWMSLKTAVTFRDDQTVLDECERGEDYARTLYANAVKMPMPSEVMEIVRRQLDGTIRHHERIRALRGQYADAT
jgi:uncharacterized protein (TIGR02284 family)